MLYKNLALGLVLSGATLALTACGGGNGSNGNGDEPNIADCDTSAPDANDPNCYCGATLVPVGGDCECDTSDAADPDCDFCDYPENADDPECSDVPEADPFVPNALNWGGLFAYDAELDVVRPWASSSGAVPPYISFTLVDARFQGTSNNNFRCGLAFIPTSEDGTVPARVEEYEFTWGSDSGDVIETDTHLFFELLRGEYEVVDNPNDEAQNGRIPGCIEVAEDPMRGFPPDFSEGDISAWVQQYDWAIGMGPMGFGVRNAFEDTEGEIRADYDAGLIGGGSMRIFDSEDVEEEPFDLYLPGSYVFGFEVDPVDFTLVMNGDEGVIIPAAEQLSSKDGVRPKTGRYSVNALYSFTFN